MANLGSFRILLPFSRKFLGVGVLNSAIFNSFHNRVEFDTILEGLQNFEGWGRSSNTSTPPPLGTPLYACGRNIHKIGNASVTKHRGAFAYPFLQWKSEKFPLCMSSGCTSLSMIRRRRVLHEKSSGPIYVASNNEVSLGLCQ